MEDKVILKFVPLKSFVHPNFWYKLADIKLHIDKLSDGPKSIRALVSNGENSRVIAEIDCTAFNVDTTIVNTNLCCNGILLNKNTIEEFKITDKNELLKQVSVAHYRDLLFKEKLHCSSQVLLFTVFSFADFKTNKYYYWFAFPVLRDLTYTYSGAYRLLETVLSEQCLSNFKSELNQINDPFFIYDAGSYSISKLIDSISHSNKSNNFCNASLENIYFCCRDFSTDEKPSWILRQFLGYLFMTCPILAGKRINCLCLRKDVKFSIVYQVQIPHDELDLDEAPWIGWEANDNGKLLPRMADMAKIMDPLTLAKESISLNLTLMKWRLLPDLDLEIIRKTKFLLMGAGTLGCGVARSLLAWGAQHISFVDYGHVSLSNPVRQNLFLYEDALGGGKPKASTAAERVKQIHPSMVSTGYCMQIPMPGHPIGESQINETIETLESLKELIQIHDVLFLLTDSRESRWLPTMLAAFYRKMVITAALGFDSYLVMRHGSKMTATIPLVTIKGYKQLPGFRLGCYFCTDIVAPGNSVKDRTLDQQCTVTRPAVSNIASSLAVELAVSLLQHESRDAAPAYYRLPNSDDQTEDVPEGILGVIPHSIRGNISNFNHLITATEQFSECIACSKHVMAKYEQDGNAFIINVLNSSKILEDISGVSKLTDDAIEDIDFESDEE
ncbi:ubiquitin-like modifier-activating enzyme ATG7 isoform X2 [Wyeomyia smithii]|uniref:ubiquitin-like modifier-activating enzyme ATG7 isoform X2 n=1 Tax=Wyeomyia smithii TaxID=174621 RepID=UPI0024682045|nr:ubiquitin-like modifier-activating enzyme ATG7 isoform X2 [Wyeomyia smithii]